MGTVTVTVTEVGGNTVIVDHLPHLLQSVITLLRNVPVPVPKWRVILLRSIRPSHFHGEMAMANEVEGNTAGAVLDPPSYVTQDLSLFLNLNLNPNPKPTGLRPSALRLT